VGGSMSNYCCEVKKIANSNIGVTRRAAPEMKGTAPKAPTKTSAQRRKICQASHQWRSQVKKRKSWQISFRAREKLQATPP